MAEALALRSVRAGYGATVVLEDVNVTLAERGSLAVLGRNGVGKTTLMATIVGHTTFQAGSIEYRGRPIARLPVYARSRLGIGYVPQTRDIFLPHPGGKSSRGRAPRTLDARARLRAVPASGRAPAADGNGPLGRRAADALDRTRPHGKSVAPAPGRAAGRTGAHHRGCAPGGPGEPPQRGGAPARHQG